MNTSENKILSRGLDTRAAALYTGLSVGYLLRARSTLGNADNAPPIIRIGKRVLYLRDDLDLWLEKSRIEGAKSRSSL